MLSSVEFFNLFPVFKCHNNMVSYLIGGILSFQCTLRSSSNVNFKLNWQFLCFSFNCNSIESCKKVSKLVIVLLAQFKKPARKARVEAAWARAVRLAGPWEQGAAAAVEAAAVDPPFITTCHSLPTVQRSNSWPLVVKARKWQVVWQWHRVCRMACIPHPAIGL